MSWHVQSHILKNCPSSYGILWLGNSIVEEVATVQTMCWGGLVHLHWASPSFPILSVIEMPLLHLFGNNILAAGVNECLFFFFLNNYSSHIDWKWIVQVTAQLWFCPKRCWSGYRWSVRFPILRFWDQDKSWCCISWLCFLSLPLTLMRADYRLVGRREQLLEGLWTTACHLPPGTPCFWQAKKKKKNVGRLRWVKS